MPFNITYNSKGETKIIENGEVKDDLKLQWEKNNIDKSVLNNINRSPKVLFGERVGLGSDDEDQQQVPEFNVEIEINGSNFITEEEQRILINPIVTDIDSGDIISDEEYITNWYLNGDLLDVPQIFELNTKQLDNESNNIIKLEVLINNRILVDKSSILKYLGFSSGSDVGEENDTGEENNQISGGGVIESDNGIQIMGSFKTNDAIIFNTKVENNTITVWNLGDGNNKRGKKVRHSYDNGGVYNIEAKVIKNSVSVNTPNLYSPNVYSAKAKIKIVE